MYYLFNSNAGRIASGDRATEVYWLIDHGKVKAVKPDGSERILDIVDGFFDNASALTIKAVKGAVETGRRSMQKEITRAAVLRRKSRTADVSRILPGVPHDA
jgi:hypothetical protein